MAYVVTMTVYWTMTGSLEMELQFKTTMSLGTTGIMEMMMIQRKRLSKDYIELQETYI